MGHDHAGHAHDHAVRGSTYGLGVALNLAFVLVEAGCGWFAGSMALLADAGHNLSDVLGLVLAWGAAVLAQRAPTARRTYGLRRTTTLAALLNAIVLLVAIGGIAWEAVRRMAAPPPVSGKLVMLVAGIGFVVNATTALLFWRGRQHDLNVRGAFLHMAADAGISLGVVVAGLLLMTTGLSWIDPVVSLVIVAVILVGTWSLLRESLDLTLDAVPAGVDVDGVRAYLASLPGVASVHDLHVWGMSTTETALTAHLVRPGHVAEDDLLHHVATELRDRFAIAHATVQIEGSRHDEPCVGCDAV